MAYTIQQLGRATALAFASALRWTSSRPRRTRAGLDARCAGSFEWLHRLAVSRSGCGSAIWSMAPKVFSLFAGVARGKRLGERRLTVCVGR